MSSKAPVGLVFMEKLIGLIMMAVGVTTFYVTYISLPSLPVDPLIFLGIGIILIILGLLLFIAKTE